MTDMKKAQMYTDGGARGNPGPAAIGVVFKENGKTVDTLKLFIGDTTNNQAEYQAVIHGLQRAEENGYTHLEVFMDSQLVAEQLNRNYKIKDKGLQKLFVEAWNSIQGFASVTFTFIPREQNEEADKLVNEALDEGEKIDRVEELEEEEIL